MAVIEQARPVTSPSAAPNRHELRTLTLHVLGIAVVTRIALALAAWLSVRTIPRFGPYPAQLDDRFLSEYPFLDGWARWDVSHYVAVASLGYGDPESPSAHGGVGFFPVFPLLMRGLVEVVGAEPTPAALSIAALVISNVSFLVAVVLLAHLTARQFGPRVGRTAALVMCALPFSFFFNAAYSESLFLALVVGSLTLAQRDRWWGAALLAGVATGTRLVGLALVPALVLMAYRRGARPPELAGIAALSASGTIAFFIYLAVATGDPLAYFTAQATWGSWQDHVWYYADFLINHPYRYFNGDPRRLVIALNVLLGLSYLGFLPWVWRRLDVGIATFTTLLVVVQLAMTWVSLGRYLLPAFGVIIAVAAVLERWQPSPPRGAHGSVSAGSWWLRDAVLIASSILLSLLTALFAAGFWVV